MNARCTPILRSLSPVMQEIGTAHTDIAAGSWVACIILKLRKSRERLFLVWELGLQLWQKSDRLRFQPFVISFTLICAVALNIIVGAWRRVSSVSSQKYAETKPEYSLFWRLPRPFDCSVFHTNVAKQGISGLSCLGAVITISSVNCLMRSITHMKTRA